MKTIIYPRFIPAVTALLLLFAACDVKDPIYDTAHPEHGKVTLAIDWSDIGAGLTIPAGYTVATTGYSADLSGAASTIDHLFAPGDYRFCVYNRSENIAVNGSVAAVAAVTAPAGQAGAFVHGSPGWLFACAFDTMLEKDREYALTAVMRQQMRQLTLVIEPAGGAPERIESITAALSGVAATLDFASGTHGTPSAVPLVFTRISTGADAGKWAATVRLLGIAGAAQRLEGTILFTGGNPAPMAFDSDLSAALAEFNAAKRTPFLLGGTVVDTPTGAGSSATITGWIPGGSGSGSAE